MIINKNLFHVLFYIILIGIIIILIILLNCKRNNNIYNGTTADTVTTIQHQIIVYKDTVQVVNWYPKEIIVHNIDSVPYPIYDTLRLWYYSEKIYDYHYIDTDKLEINADIKVSENSLKTLCFDYKVYQKTDIITNNIYNLPKYEILVGVGGVIQKYPDITLGVGLRLRRNNIIINYGFVQKQIILNYYYSIFYSKK